MTTSAPLDGATFKDKYGIEWQITKAASGNLTAHLTGPAYATGPGQDVIAAQTYEQLQGEANDYADDYIKSGGKPPQLATATVNAGGSGGLILVLLALFALSKGRR